MDRVLIKVYVPSLEKSYDFFVPTDVRLHEIIALISSALEQYTEGEYRSSHKEVLCTKEDGKVLDINYAAYELGICNGSKLVLI